jgi:hypothetical protein
MPRCGAGDDGADPAAGRSIWCQRPRLEEMGIFSMMSSSHRSHAVRLLAGRAVVALAFAPIVAAASVADRMLARPRQVRALLIAARPCGAKAGCPAILARPAAILSMPESSGSAACSTSD